MTSTKQRPPKAWDHQTKGLDFIRDKPGAMLAMEMGTGKDLEDNTPIPTTEGWTPMGEIKVGQRVFDERGQPCTVKGVYPQGERPVYKVVFDDGAVITAGHKHLWITLSDRQRGRTAPESWATGLTPITTEEIRDSLVHQRDSPEESAHSIPLAMPLDLPEAELPIDPYLMGLWLGDISHREPEITCHRDYEPLRAAAAAQAGGSFGRTERSGNTLTPAAEPPTASGPGERETLNDRRIPQRYLRASVEQRNQLMQGLIDADGRMDPLRGDVELTSTSRMLAEGMLELAMSLGQKATISPGEAAPEGWRVQISPVIDAASPPRQRRIQAVEDAGTAPTTCITVDSPSRLFLAGRQMVPTHNSRVAIDLMEELNSRRVLILAPLSVVDYVWPGEIRKHTIRDQVVIPLGEKVPNVRKKVQQAAEGLALASARRAPAVVIVNYESAYREPLASWIKDIHWDLFIMDESHKLKNASGQISRFASQVADRSARRLALTGTPMPHSPMDIYAQYRAIDKKVFGVNYGAFKTRYAEFETVGRPITKVDRNGQEYTETPRAISGYQNLEDLNQLFYSLAFRVTAADTLDLPSAIETYTHVELCPKARRIYDEMAVSFRADLDSGEIVTAANALARLVRFQQLTSGFAVTPEGKTLEVDDSKARALNDILDGLPIREPVVVFARFQNDLDRIASIAGKLKRPHYEISGRVKNLEEWRENGGVLAVQIQAGGLGLDLTASRYCVYYSLGFSLGDYLQSIARLHRPGQTSMVDYIHLTAADSIDEIINGALADKEDVVQRILETRDLTNGSLGRRR